MTRRAALMLGWLVASVTLGAASFVAAAPVDAHGLESQKVNHHLNEIAANPAVAAPPAVDRNRLSDILEREPYQRWKRRQQRAQPDGAGDSALGQAIVDVIERFFDWLSNLFKGVNWPNAPSMPSLDLAGIIKTVGWFMLALLAVVVAIFGYRLLRMFHEKGPRARVLSREQVKAALEEGHALALGAADWLKEADRFAQGSDSRWAYRAFYLALLSGLHSAGKIDFRKSRTNWIYVRRYRGSADDQQLFAQLTEMFDRVWYGDKPADPSRLDELKQQVGTLIGPGASHV